MAGSSWRIAGPVYVTGAEAAPHALDRLSESLPRAEFRPAPAADGVPAITFARAGDLPEGGFRISAEVGEGAPRVEIAGGSLSGLIWGAEALITRAGEGALDLSALPVEETPGLAYRTFWTWDHSTNWELSQIGQQEIGVFNPYGKPPEGFLADYKRMVDWCSRNRVAAIVIYGFLRDSHGGIEAAQELCRYAARRGVRILPGIAIGAYGGVYWEGDHRYNLATWLRANPEFAATLEKGVGFQLADLEFPLNFPRSDYTLSACPSRPEVMDWMTEAVTWLAETFEIGGINIESGDYGVCGCDRCRSRRAAREDAARRAGIHDESWSHADMADNFPRLFEAARARRPDAWVYCEMQWDNLLDREAQKAAEGLPPGGIYQHTANKGYWRTLRDGLTRAHVESLPTRPNVLRCQFACQWNGDARTERYAMNARSFAEMAEVGHRVGMQGLTVWGEPSPYHATVEVSYRAFARFGWEPALGWEGFVAGEVAPMMGGEEAAARFLALTAEIDANRALPVARLAAIRDEAAAHARATTGEASRRWMSVADQVARRHYMGA